MYSLLCAIQLVYLAFFVHNKHMNQFPTPRELAAEAQAALDAAPMTPKEHFEFMIQQGIIDREGRVLVCRYFRTDKPEDQDGTPQPPQPAGTNGA